MGLRIGWYRSMTIAIHDHERRVFAELTERRFPDYHRENLKTQVEECVREWFEIKLNHNDYTKTFKQICDLDNPGCFTANCRVCASRIWFLPRFKEVKYFFGDVVQEMNKDQTITSLTSIEDIGNIKEFGGGEWVEYTTRLIYLSVRIVASHAKPQRGLKAK